MGAGVDFAEAAAVIETTVDGTAPSSPKDPTRSPEEACADCESVGVSESKGTVEVGAIQLQAERAARRGRSKL